VSQIFVTINFLNTDFMRKKLFIAGCIALMVPCTLLVLPARAVQEGSKQIAVDPCYQGGVIVGYGNHCVGGEGTCVENPCGS
jgi:hypothetical protein